MGSINLGSYLLATGIICGLSFAFLLAIVRANYPQSIGGVTAWLLACVMLAAASVFISGAFALPDLVRQFVGHLFFLGGAGLLLVGLRSFAGQPTHAVRVAASLAAVLCALGVTSYASGSGQVPVLITMAVAIMLAQASIAVVIALPQKSLPEHFATASLVGLIALYSLRITIICAELGSVNLWQGEHLAQTIYVVGLSACFVCLMASFLLLTAKRLRQTLVFAEVYDELDVKQRTERWRTGEDLRLAIERNELEVHYQPRVNAHSGRVVGVEALLRWKHGTRGYIGPDCFIPIAEDNGAIHAIGTWVLREAIACAARIGRRDPAIRVSINVSARQLARCDFVDLVRETLALAGMAPERIELELTETIALEDPHGATATLRELRALGVHLSIDDFGTGYSSLAYLTRLPITCVKIDRSLISDLTTRADARALTDAIIGIGNALGVGIVAEGVESEAQLDILREGGVSEYQGYLFSKPLPEAALMALLEHNRERCAVAA